MLAAADSADSAAAMNEYGSQSQDVEGQDDADDEGVVVVLSC